MKFSLIVATIGRTGELQSFLGSLDAQKCRDFEVIVVDQNANLDITPFLMNRRFPIRHVRSSPGASHARNAGLRMAQGEIIAFPDDDCTYEADTLSAVADFFESHPDVGAVIGKWKSCVREEVGRYGIFHQAGTCFYFLRREWTERIGEFDEDFGPGPDSRYRGGEDTDYLIRGRVLGMRIFREPTIVIRHPDMSFDSNSRRKVRLYGVARMALLRKHRYSLWFRLANLLFPVFKMVLCPTKICYLWEMFRGRLEGILRS